MNDKFCCLHCKKMFRVNPVHIGKKVRCPHCQAIETLDAGTMGARESASTSVMANVPIPPSAIIQAELSRPAPYPDIPVPRPAPNAPKAEFSIALIVGVASLVVFLVAGGALWFWFFRGDAPLIENVLDINKDQPDQAWVNFTSKDGRIRAEFPLKPEVQKEMVPGIEKPMTLIGVDQKEKNVGFFLLFVDINENQLSSLSVEQRFDRAKNGVLNKQPNSQLLEESPIQSTLGPCRQFVILIPGQGKMVARVYLIHRRLVVMLAGGPDFTPDTPDVQRFFTSLTIVDGPSQPPPDISGWDGLVSYWRFNEGTGNSSVNFDPKEPSATLHNASWVQGVEGKGVRLGRSGPKGMEPRIDLGTSPKCIFPENSAFSIAGWFKPEKSETLMLHFQDSFPLQPFDWRINFGKLKMFQIQGPELVDGVWHHLAMTRNIGGTITMFVNGKPMGTGTNYRGASNPKIRQIGPFEGSVDELCIFNRELTQAEIAQLACQKSSEPPPDRILAHANVISSLSFSPDGKTVLTATSERDHVGFCSSELILWDVGTRLAQRAWCNGPHFLDHGLR